MSVTMHELKSHVFMCRTVPRNILLDHCNRLNSKDQLGCRLMLFGMNQDQTPQKISKLLKEPKIFS